MHYYLFPSSTIAFYFLKVLLRSITITLLHYTYNYFVNQNYFQFFACVLGDYQNNPSIGCWQEMYMLSFQVLIMSSQSVYTSTVCTTLSFQEIFRTPLAMAADRGVHMEGVWVVCFYPVMTCISRKPSGQL